MRFTFEPIINIDIIAALINCILTAVLLFVAYSQLKSLNRTNNAQFLHNLAARLFTDETIKLITLLHADCILFDENNNNPIFYINKTKIKKIYPKRNWKERDYYTTYEIDCLILNDLDRVGSLVENKITGIKWAYQDFGWYTGVALNNIAILQYLTWIEKYENTTFVFSKLKILNQKFEKLDKT